MLNQVRRAVTLIEILVVIIIIGILAALALPNLSTMRERTFDQEAKTNLKLIQAAQKIYKMEEGFYYHYTGTGGTAGINNMLKLFLPTGDKRNWDYTSAGGADNFTAKAIRYNPPSNWDRTWTVTKDDTVEPTCSESLPPGACPSP